jgi:hypothetical protein
MSMSLNHIHNTLVLLHILIQPTETACRFASFTYSKTLALFCKLHFISRPDHASKTAICHCDAHFTKFNRIDSLATSSVIGTATWVGGARREV